MHYKSIFISDIHLGTRGCQADALCDFLKHNTADNIFLIGDIIDGWRLSRRWYFPQNHANVIRRLLTAAKRGAKVYYILGNHDEYLRRFLPFDISFGAIKILNNYTYVTNHKKYCVIHGDAFDKVMKNSKWLMLFGDNLYNFLIWMNIKLNIVRKILGMNYWSLSKYLKAQTKQAFNFILKFEETVALHCHQRGFDGIICGHIHTPANKNLHGIHYINTGDWVESCTAVVEKNPGQFEIINYKMGCNTQKN